MGVYNQYYRTRFENVSVAMVLLAVPIASSSVANPTLVTTSIAHGLVTGDVVRITGHTSTPTINGTRTVTRVSDTTFTVPVNVTVGGGAGGFVNRETTTLIDAKTGHTTFIQAIIVTVTLDAAIQLAFQDDAGTPVVFHRTPSLPGLGASDTSVDFGPEGVPLTEATALQMVISDAGLSAAIEVIAYQRRTALSFA